MKIAIGADHAGFVLKEKLKRRLAEDGHEVIDFGTDSEQSCDYPDYAQAVAREVARERFDRGLLLCGTGIGMSIAANKVNGIRAAHVSSKDEAGLARSHNDANVLALSAKALDEDHAYQLVRIFLETEFTGGRHARRIAKITLLEQGSR